MKYFSFLIVLIFFIGCTTNIKHGGSRFSLPENLAQGGFGFDFQLNQGAKLRPTEDLSFTPIEKEPLVEESRFLTTSLGYGLFDALNIEITTGHDQPIFGHLKWQILGDTVTNAGAGNFSLALSLGFGLFVTAGELSQEEVKGANQEKRTWTIDSGTWRYDALIGYRIIDPLLLYGGYFLEQFSYQLAFNEGISDVLKYEGSNRGPHLGVAFISAPLTIKLNVSTYTYEIPDEDETLDSLALGLSLGMAF